MKPLADPVTGAVDRACVNAQHAREVARQQVGVTLRELAEEAERLQRRFEQGVRLDADGMVEAARRLGEQLAVLAVADVHAGRLDTLRAQIREAGVPA